MGGTGSVSAACPSPRRPAIANRQSENKPAQILILRKRLESLPHEPLIHNNSLLAHIRRIKTTILEHAFQNRVQPPGPDVLRRPVHVIRQVGHRFDRGICEFQGDSLRAEQSVILPQQAKPAARARCGRNRRV